VTTCLLCDLPARDDHGLCIRVSRTHDLIRNPENYPREHHSELWDAVEHALTTGTSVFTETIPCHICHQHTATKEKV